jgi:hypothetical protein
LGARLCFSDSAGTHEPTRKGDETCNGIHSAVPHCTGNAKLSAEEGVLICRRSVLSLFLFALVLSGAHTLRGDSHRRKPLPPERRLGDLYRRPHLHGHPAPGGWQLLLLFRGRGQPRPHRDGVTYERAVRSDSGLRCFELSVSLAGSASGMVTSNAGGIICPGICTATLGSGIPITLTATPLPGADFREWRGRAQASWLPVP